MQSGLWWIFSARSIFGIALTPPTHKQVFHRPNFPQNIPFPFHFDQIGRNFFEKNRSIIHVDSFVGIGKIWPQMGGGPLSRWRVAEAKSNMYSEGFWDVDSRFRYFTCMIMNTPARVGDGPEGRLPQFPLGNSKILLHKSLLDPKKIENSKSRELRMVKTT